VLRGAVPRIVWRGENHHLIRIIVPQPDSIASATTSQDREVDLIVQEEQRCLTRVLEHLTVRTQRRSERPTANIDYASQMIALRDEIAVARLEDVPPLVEQMERLQMLAAHRREQTESFVDVRSPYFGRMVLEENGRRREVLIGRSTYLDTQSGIRIVDWRDAPVSRLYYRYEEGDEYDEIFGERELSGRVVTRRSVSIVDGELRRIATPQGTFARGSRGAWRRLGDAALKLAGGQGTATRPERPGKLGSPEAELSDDKHLKEITALIDRRQFELITSPDSGLVVIQGGAGSGKTTIGLHRLAYLAFKDARRFRPDRMLVVVFNQALARYISQVLPALGIAGVAIRTYENWAERARISHLPELPRGYSDETPNAVTRLKKHPAMLRAIDDYASRMEAKLEAELERQLEAGSEQAAAVRKAWKSSSGRPVAHRAYGLLSHLQGERGRALPVDLRLRLERAANGTLKESRDIVACWADLLSDRPALARVFSEHAPGALSDGDLSRAHAWCAQRSDDILAAVETAREEQAAAPKDSGETRTPRGNGKQRAGEDDAATPDLEITHAVDGRLVEEDAALDREDDALLLRLWQKLRGPLLRGSKGKEPLVYEHVLIDEAQDLSPVELAVVQGTVSPAQSITLAGDVAQRLLMDNGFTDWSTVLADLGLSHVAVEPLELSYRSTTQIIEFANAVLGPLAPARKPVAIRSGSPVDLFRFAHTGDAVGFLGEALRELSAAEPRASVAVIARYPEQADIWYHGLEKGEVPYLRRVADQDFAFRPGVDVTDVKQVKGLEFDYVILVEVNDSAYPTDDEARHLLHIGATRAAHQLWIVASGRPSTLLPSELLERAY
jgi:DNA helicase II / ATP-dependent DNA helicase PcrA